MPGGFADFVAELFEPIGGVTLRRMFGGLGVFRDGAMFGIVDDDVLYLKVDDETIPAYEAEGCGPFSYPTRNGIQETASYRRVPERLYDDPDEFLAWARTSLDATRRRADAARTRKAKRRPKGGDEAGA